ncbi:hypothetical protein PF339_003325 [Salmonella enterica]|nr:hypothetical protein [Salmonella enterica]EDH6653197.1 hypothetical protein [Salmonella enterica subsp. enterica serovar Okatie]EIV1999293.1 hypothetical protein [Salmonella enterica subsp. enterica serovar Telelkebir]EDK0939797.1 hypothetical protein [Salmonella enterica]EHM6138294.1 hypothetical protein [Salmonella enterica]EHM6196036.1 hypothetical protein [Salmonella enterica]
MLFKARPRKVLVQCPDGAPQMPARRGQNQKVIHVARVRHMPVLTEGFIRFREVKGGQQGAQGTAPGYPFLRCVKLAAILHAVVQKLAEQVSQHRTGHVPAQLVIQQGPADVGVIPPDIGAEHERVAAGQQPRMSPLDGRFPAAVTAEVLTPM